ncbi:hypothetical protein ONE63_003137 [Megalurothrips usitatus]|uniref:Uncharacterized protein n=1 Tax=Megalurothrips usitatus TaxID=439358 RepID=A0AAV7X6E5_9NEOP|nr:hypothetical protein ONE63_003137 [Megalurothrips usitatus]
MAAAGAVLVLPLAPLLLLLPPLHAAGRAGARGTQAWTPPARTARDEDAVSTTTMTAASGSSSQSSAGPGPPTASSGPASETSSQPPVQPVGSFVSTGRPPPDEETASSTAAADTTATEESPPTTTTVTSTTPGDDLDARMPRVMVRGKNMVATLPAASEAARARGGAGLGIRISQEITITVDEEPRNDSDPRRGAGALGPITVPLLGPVTIGQGPGTAPGLHGKASDPGPGQARQASKIIFTIERLGDWPQQPPAPDTHTAAAHDVSVGPTPAQSPTTEAADTARPADALPANSTAAVVTPDEAVGVVGADTTSPLRDDDRSQQQPQPEPTADVGVPLPPPPQPQAAEDAAARPRISQRLLTVDAASESARRAAGRGPTTGRPAPTGTRGPSTPRRDQAAKQGRAAGTVAAASTLPSATPAGSSPRPGAGQTRRAGKTTKTPAAPGWQSVPCAEWPLDSLVTVSHDGKV